MNKTVDYEGLWREAKLFLLKVASQPDYTDYTPPEKEVDSAGNIMLRVRYNAGRELATKMLSKMNEMETNGKIDAGVVEPCPRCKGKGYYKNGYTERKHAHLAGCATGMAM